VSDYEIVSNSMAFAVSGSMIVKCPGGKVVLSGGAEADVDSVNIYSSRPLITGGGWYVRASGEGDFTLDVFAICAAPAD
jgi:hypothetical protein